MSGSGQRGGEYLGAALSDACATGLRYSITNDSQTGERAVRVHIRKAGDPIPPAHGIPRSSRRRFRNGNVNDG